MKKLSRKEAAHHLAPLVFPDEYELRAAVNKVQATFTYHIKKEYLPHPPWRIEVLMEWASWMATRNADWARLQSVFNDLPAPKPPKGCVIATGRATAPIRVYVLPSPEHANAELIRAWDRIRELEDYERRYRRDVKNGREGGRGHEK